MEIIPIIYNGENKYGDFKWMIKNIEYKDSLFIFNDNIESKYSYKNGLGNAIIRSYNVNNPNINIPLSAGIPTGSLKYNGFDSLSDKNKKYIDDSINIIKELILKYKYKRIYYSAESNGLLGQSLFKVNSEVVKYITNQIHELNYITLQE